MPYQSYLDPWRQNRDELEDEGGALDIPPASSVASRPLMDARKATYETIKNKHFSDKSNINDVASPPPSDLSQDPLMQQYERDQADLDVFRQARMQSDFVGNMGQAFSQLAMGTNAPTMNPVFQRIAEQNKAMDASKAADADRRRKVMEAIENRNMRKEVFEGQKAERDFYKNQMRQDKLERDAKPSDKQAEALGELDKAASDLQNIGAMRGDNKDWTGPIAGRIPDLLAGDQQAAFRSALGRYKDAYRKAITGAGASGSELAMLERRLPTETDSHENFNAKLQESLNEIGRHKGLMLSNLKKLGKNVSAFEGAPTIAQGQSQQTKVLDGITYRKVPGGWEAIE